MLRTVLVADGAGYIGSHAHVELIDSGYQRTVVDNLSNLSGVSPDRVERISGVGSQKTLKATRRMLKGVPVDAC